MLVAHTISPVGLRDAASDQAVDWLRQHLAADAHVCADSRRIAPGDGFFARAGRRSTDQAAHIAQAISAGAKAIVVDTQDSTDSVAQIPAAVPTLGVPYLAQRIGMIASAFYGRPSFALQLIAVTGTNGKSTVTAATAFALARCGIAAAAIGTLGVAIFPAHCAADFTPEWRDDLTGGLTTPDPADLQRLFSALKKQGVTAVALEASSVGIEQGRLAGCAIKVAAFINLSHDHLDLHGSMQEYAKAKALLFKAESLASAVINTDDDYAELMWGSITTRVQRIAVGNQPPSNADAVLRAVSLAPTVTGWDFELDGTGKAQKLAGPVSLPVHGEHNVENALIVAGCLLAMKVNAADVRPQLNEFHLPAGRLEEIAPASGQPGPRAYVDYAHSPDALTRILQALRPLAERRQGQLVCVFGCGGDRDAGKRPLMGEIAARLADRVVLTSDNPRTEPVDTILKQIVAGIPATQAAKVTTIEDRGQAIALAITHAAAHDVVLIAGRGHEQIQVVGDQRVAFSDAAHAQRAMDAWRAATQPTRAEGTPCPR
jgi:UDP-N-acetylmuramyl-tripeptide synthetase